MKLYYSPGACSLAPHIALIEAGLEFDREQVDLRAHRTASGSELGQVHGKNYVPILELDNGECLTEGPVILQYIADLQPDAGLIFRPGTMARYRVQEWLCFVASELHKPFIPLLTRDRSSSDWQQWATATLGRRFEWISGQLWERPWVAGDHYTVADTYLFVVTRWSAAVGIDLSPWPILRDYQARIANRPGVVEAMKAEGLVQAAAA
ncbi:glutathione S-transferase [Povalibacter uvarum]|uniref:Glutathione S-transferase n=1 Tax=Povalibacter uvarum TaxID=732238 RepID=A0A841HMI1_9GAMM|nr:glutathione transferase GstA [Povalibacter uvarum]MBB6093165.1 glutathione S-transferase [Povalibacter uvarum]